MSASEPMNCCPPTRCALTPPGEYTAKGKFHSVENNPLNNKSLRYYKVSPAKASRKAIVLINDIFGLDVGRHVGVADSFSEIAGVTVVIPDLFRGDNCKFEWLGKPEFVEMAKRHPIEDVQKDLDYCYQNLVPATDFDVIVLAGFCWGAWVVFNEGSRVADKRIKGGINMHPALVLAGMFGSSDVALIAEQKIPHLICPCSDDDAKLKPGDECLVSTHMIHVFENQNHGFVTQGDISKVDVQKDVEVAVELVQCFVDLVTKL